MREHWLVVDTPPTGSGSSPTSRSHVTATDVRPQRRGVRLSRPRGRSLSVALVLVTGTADLLVALVPGLAGHLEVLGDLVPRHVAVAGRGALALTGVGLLLLSAALRRGYRRAWVLALLLSAGSVLLHVVRGLDVANLVLSGSLVVSLVATTGSFRTRARTRPSWLLAAVPSVLGTGLAFGWMEFSRSRAGLPKLPPAERLSAVARAMIGLDPGVTATTRIAQAVLDVLPLFGLAALVLVFGALVAPRLEQSTRRRPDELREFVAKYGRSSSAPLVCLEDNRTLALRGDHALVGLQVHAGVALVLGGPIGPDETTAPAWRELMQRCDSHGWVPAVLGADRRQADLTATMGLRQRLVGQEAVLDVALFSTEGKQRASVRHSVTRAHRDGLTVARCTATDLDQETAAGLRAVSDAWLSHKHGPELGFTLGRFDPAELHGQDLYVASVEGRPVAFITWLPFDAGSRRVLDLMRRGPEAPPGTMEALIVAAIADFATRGVVSASLGGVPLAGTTGSDDRIDMMLGWMYEHGGGLYDAKSLYAFKAKFAPAWEPMYLLYRTGADLPRIATAAALAFLPHPWRRTLAKQVLGAARGHVAGLLDRYRSVRAASAGARVTVPVVTVALFGAVLMAAVAWHGLTGPTSPQAIARWSWSPRLVADGEWWRVLTAIVVTRNGLMAVPMLVSITVIGAYERLVGSWRTLVFAIGSGAAGYLLTGTMILALAPVWEPVPGASTHLDVGASGAIAACFVGLAVALRTWWFSLAVGAGAVLQFLTSDQVAAWEHLWAMVVVLVLCAATGALRTRGRPGQGDVIS